MELDTFFFDVKRASLAYQNGFFGGAVCAVDVDEELSAVDVLNAGVDLQGKFAKECSIF